MSLSTVYKRKKIAIKCIYSSRKMCLVTMFVFSVEAEGGGGVWRETGTLRYSALQKKRTKSLQSDWIQTRFSDFVDIFLQWE